MSENAEGKPEEMTEKGHTSKKEASFLARAFGWVAGRQQAGVAEPPVENLAERIKQLGPEAANEAVDAAISAYREEKVRQEQAEKPPAEPEQG